MGRKLTFIIGELCSEGNGWQVIAFRTLYIVMDMSHFC